MNDANVAYLRLCLWGEEWVQAGSVRDTLATAPAIPVTGDGRCMLMTEHLTYGPSWQARGKTRAGGVLQRPNHSCQS